VTTVHEKVFIGTTGGTLYRVLVFISSLLSSPITSLYVFAYRYTQFSGFLCCDWLDSELTDYVLETCFHTCVLAQDINTCCLYILWKVSYVT